MRSLIRLSVLPGAFCIWLAYAPAANAQNLLPNRGFEQGSDRPDGWEVPAPSDWTTPGVHGGRGLRMEGTGQGTVSARSEPITLEPGGLYSLRFMARREAGASGGCVISGPASVNRDFRPGDSWNSFGFIFCLPHNSQDGRIRLGHWELKGGVTFDDPELLPVLASHRQGPSGIVLGEGERIENGVYHFNPDFGWAGANFHRPLHLNRLTFNSDRWCFGLGSELIYRFALPGLHQTSGAVRVNVNHHVAGSLRIEASTDGRQWTPAATCPPQTGATRATLPAALFPAAAIFVRLTTSEGPANLQINALDYEAALHRPVEDRDGQTWFVAIQKAAPDLGVHLNAVHPDAGHASMRIDWSLTNRSDRPLSVAAACKSASGESRKTATRVIPAGQTVAWPMNVEVVRPGRVMLEVDFADENDGVLFMGAVDAVRSVLLDPRAGRPIPGHGKDGLWWCESGWKIGRDAPAPAADPTTESAVTISAARGEYEAAQVILPPKWTTLVSAQVTALKSAAGADSRIQVTLSEVVYLRVTRPTDNTCERGWYPDPLPSLQTPFKLPRHNQPIWITAHIPDKTKAGDYTGELVLTFDNGSKRVPLAVHVYDFALPRESHLRTALGLGTQTINRYHALTNREQQKLVYEKYLANFAEHRISPYSFFAYSPIEVRFIGEGSDKRARVDFTSFDRAAEKWLDDAHLSSFRLPLRGMGGGTFHSRHLGSLEGFEEGTPEFARLFNDYLGQVANHLRERGWLSKAYTYWFDEPDPKDYAFVTDGMKRIQAAAPGLRRMLTEQPEKELAGHVEIWCGLTPEWTREKVAERRAAGEEVWWYVCTGPKAPYITLFIDHPGTEMRLWPWQSWQYGVQGLLVWETTYWNSSAAFPAPKMQDPWVDPMGYVSGYDFKPGHVGYWGNGDGRFVYPPRRDYLNDRKPCLDGPVNSIRWENLRDGMEDYEYFWLLDQEIKQAETRGGPTDLTRAAQRLLEIPEQISRDLTHFTTDPRSLLAHRHEIAKMIEKLRKGKPQRN